jgi:hypothetical protein
VFSTYRTQVRCRNRLEARKSAAVITRSHNIDAASCSYDWRCWWRCQPRRVAQPSKFRLSGLLTRRPCLTSGPTFGTLRPWKRTLPASDSGPTPRRAKSDFLSVHRSLFQKLPPLLRIYVLCAAHRYGDPAQADLIKIHKHSRKVTFQHYDDFDGKPLPQLQTRIKVNLRNLFVEVFDHSVGPKTQILYFKERFVGKDYPHRRVMERFSAKLRKLGLDENTIGFGPDKEGFRSLLATINGNETFSRIIMRALG